MGDDTMPSTAEKWRRSFDQPRGPGRLLQPSQEKTAAPRPAGGSRPKSSRGHLRARAIQSSSTATSTRLTSLDALAKLKPIVRKTARSPPQCSGVNEGAAALIIASEESAKRNGLTPRARILGGAVAGVPPRIMGIGPAPASEKLLKRLGLKIGEMDVIELNEAFAAQGLAVMRQLGIPDDAPHVNPNGGAIALPSVACPRPSRFDRDRGASAQRRPLRTRHHVHRRRPGNRPGARAGVTWTRPRSWLC